MVTVVDLRALPTEPICFHQFYSFQIYQEPWSSDLFVDKFSLRFFETESCILPALMALIWSL